MSNYTQPTSECILFIEDNRIFLSYIAFHQITDQNISFDVRLKKKNFPSESVNRSKNSFTKIILKIFDIFNFFQVNDFTTYHHIKNAKIKYFKKL